MVIIFSENTARQIISCGEIFAQVADNITELKTYFNSVIDWISSVFSDVDSSMRGLEWGRLYETYHRNAYDPQAISEKVQTLLADYYVNDKKGICILPCTYELGKAEEYGDLIDSASSRRAVYGGE